MKVLIIAAHGSRKAESAREVAALTEKISLKSGACFDRVDHGFLQFSEPLLPGVIDNAVALGATQIVIFPFFISAGSHILTDIPELVAESGKTYPGVEFTVTRHLGAAASVEDVILGEVNRHLGGGEG
ncbi:MAG: CbiX/SirB N-terminal domain-containing protein [Desulfobacterales bacterium]|nr:CbiX/SirB N-terminal domain-containing protein [Desulfobacterales bacterium]